MTGEPAGGQPGDHPQRAQPGRHARHADRHSAWQRVRIWLGELLIAEYVAEGERAWRYQRVMTPRFTGLRITVEPLPADGADAGAEAAADPGQTSAARLPNERLWSLTVR